MLRLHTTDWGDVYLKEKNTNRVLSVSYSSGKQPNDHFTIAIAESTSYKLSKRMYLNLDLSTSYYKTNITLIKTTKEQNTGNLLNDESYGYKKKIFTLSDGAGLIIVIR